MSFLGKSIGNFDLHDSNMNVGSFFSMTDVYDFLNIDRITVEEFAVSLRNSGLLSKNGRVDEKALYKKYKFLQEQWSSKGMISKGSLDEEILNTLFANVLGSENVFRQVPVSGLRRINVDFLLEFQGKNLFLEFNGPGHYIDGRRPAGNPEKRKKQIEDATGVECVIWPYWIQRCENNVKALFDPSMRGYGALWSSKAIFGDFTVDNPSELIIEETRRFNALGEDGVGYFYGGDAGEERNIPEHPVLSKILKGKVDCQKLVPKDWHGDVNFWLPEKLRT